MPKLKNRLRRLEDSARRDATASTAAPLVEVFMTDNGRGEPGPGEYLRGRALMRVYVPPRDHGAIDASGASSPST